MEIANVQQKRLYDGLLAATDAATAEEIALNERLPKNPSAKRRAEWAAKVCGEMERRLDAETVKRARMACHCQPPLKKFAALKRAYQASGDPEEYVRGQNALNAGASFWFVDGAVYMCYPRCYCSFVKDAPQPLPESWCYCSLGYAKAVHDYVFDCDTRVELIESVARGDARCIIKITRP